MKLMQFGGQREYRIVSEKQIQTRYLQASCETVCCKKRDQEKFERLFSSEQPLRRYEFAKTILVTKV
jgi:hypothetical protein